jgi:REP element-mobilizing transposase RayT
MGGILRELKCNPILVGGVEDHVHCLIGLARTASVSQMIEELKTGSNLWLKGKGVADFAWQGGYGVFSVSPGDILSALRYVENQEEHHRKVSFQEEYRALMTEMGVEIDERYVWD